MKLKNSYLIALGCIMICGSVQPALAADAKSPAKETPADAAAPASALEPGANYVCEAEIFYTWKPAPPPPPKNAPPDAQPEEPPSDPIKDFFVTAGDEGLVEEEVRNRLSTKIPQMQQQAMLHCGELHQDQTACIASKMKVGFEQIGRLDFAARRAMTEAINADCERTLGRCLSTEVTEPKCHINRPPDVPPAPAAGAADAAKGGAKDAKKK